MKMEYYPCFHKKNITPDWQDLVDEFPEIFLDVTDDVLSYWKFNGGENSDVPFDSKELCNLRYGFECSVGWKSLIWDFCEGVRRLSKTAREHGHEAFYKSCIIKEKFGVLTEQGDWLGKDSELYRKDYRELSSALAKGSYSVCEICGSPASCKRRRGWLFTWCDSCEQKHIK